MRRAAVVAMMLSMQTMTVTMIVMMIAMMIVTMIVMLIRSFAAKNPKWNEKKVKDFVEERVRVDLEAYLTMQSRCIVNGDV